MGPSKASFVGVATVHLLDSGHTSRSPFNSSLSLEGDLQLRNVPNPFCWLPQQMPHIQEQHSKRLTNRPKPGVTEGWTGRLHCTYHLSLSERIDSVWHKSMQGHSEVFNSIEVAELAGRFWKLIFGKYRSIT